MGNSFSGLVQLLLCKQITQWVKSDTQHAFVWPEQKVSQEQGIFSPRGSWQCCNTDIDRVLHARRQRVSTSNSISVMALACQ